RHGLERVEAGEQRVDLESAGKAAPHPVLRLERGDVLLAEKNPAGIGRQHAGHQVDQRGFAGAVRSDQGIARADRQFELDIARHNQRAEALGQAARRKGDGAHRYPPRARIFDKPPRMPFGRNITTATSSAPIQKYQYCGAMPENWSRATMKMAAPIKPP